MSDKLRELYDRFHKTRDQIVQETDEVISTIFQEVPEIMNIFVSGQTPAFADGEPCTHSQDHHFNACHKDYDSQEEESPELLKDLSALNGRQYNVSDLETMVIPEDKLKLVNHLVCDLENHLYSIRGTNFMLLFTRDEKDGYEVQYEETEYDY